MNEMLTNASVVNLLSASIKTVPEWDKSSGPIAPASVVTHHPL